MRNNEEKRDQILQAGRELILERGFNAVKLHDLLEAAEVTKGKFFHYFGSKDECFSEVLKSAISDRKFLRFEELLSQTESGEPFKNLLLLLDKAIDWHASGLASSLRLCALATLFFARSSPEMVQARAVLLSNLKTVERLIVESQARKELPLSLDPKSLSLLFPALAVGGNIMGFMAEGKNRAVESLKEFRKLLVALNAATSESGAKQDE